MMFTIVLLATLIYVVSFLAYAVRSAIQECPRPVIHARSEAIVNASASLRKCLRASQELPVATA